MKFAAITLLLCAAFIHDSTAHPTVCRKGKNGTENVVKIDLYIESLCPGCLQYLHTELDPVYKELSDYIDLTIVPFGNADFKQNSTDPEDYSFDCQHGEDECWGNQLQCCGIDRLKNDPHKYEPYIVCVDGTDMGSQKQEKCAQEAGLDNEDLQTCAYAREGRLLHHQAGVVTDQLDPPHGYVPYINVNGAHGPDGEEAFYSLKRVVCKNLSPKPPPCNSVAE